MGGPNLEVFKFGMYIMFPIGIMYYFGTNLDSRFSVPDFWPKEGQTHTIPFEKDEIKEELERLRHRRLAARARRLAMERDGTSLQGETHHGDNIQELRAPSLETANMENTEKNRSGQKGWLGLFGR